MYEVKIPQRTPWNKNRVIPRIVAAHTDFSEIMVNPNDVSGMDFHEERMLAKGRGVDTGRFSRIESVEAANKIVKEALYNTDGTVKPHVYEVYDTVKSNIPPATLERATTVYLPTIVRKKRADEPEIPGKISKNALATVYTLELAKALQIIANDREERLNFASNPKRRMLRLDSDVRLPRREANTFERFSRQNVYSAERFEAGEYVLITDDHVETGASIKSQIDTLEHNGVHVAGIASFGALTESLDLRPPVNEPYIAQILWYNKRITGGQRDIADMKVELEAALELSGISLNSLTKRELLSLATILLDDTTDSAKDFFEDLKKKFGVSENVQEGDRNTLELSQKAITTTDFFREMKIHQIMEAIMSRQPNKQTRREAGTVNEDKVTPFIFISGGGPAVGKSRMVDLLEERKFFPENTLFVSASMFEDCFSDTDFSRHFHPELLPDYFDLYKESINRLSSWAVNNGYCVVWEDHFQDPSWTRGIVRNAKDNGYEAFASGLFLDEATHRKHREDHGQIDESTPTSLYMMNVFAQNWEQLMSSGLFDHAILYHRIKPANAPDWKIGTEERIIKAAEYYTDDSGTVTCDIHPEKTIRVKNGPEVTEREVDAYEIFKRWQRIKINFDYEPGKWDEIIEGENDNFGYFSGRVVDRREKREGYPITGKMGLNQIIRPAI